MYKPDLYVYKCILIRIIDGDTMVVDIDMGLDIHVYKKIRLAGLNAESKRTNLGQKAINVVNTYFVNKGFVYLRTFKDKVGKYGRLLCELVDSDGICLNDELVKLGLASHYMVMQRDE